MRRRGTHKERVRCAHLIPVTASKPNHLLKTNTTTLKSTETVVSDAFGVACRLGVNFTRNATGHAKSGTIYRGFGIGRSKCRRVVDTVSDGKRDSFWESSGGEREGGTRGATVVIPEAERSLLRVKLFVPPQQRRLRRHHRIPCGAFQARSFIVEECSVRSQSHIRLCSIRNGRETR